MKTVMKAVALSAALLAGSANAAYINVGGVVWDPDSPFDFTSGDLMVETMVTTAGDILSGYALVTGVNGTPATTFCPGCELTYTFTGYTVTSIYGNATPSTTDDTLVFSGGTISVYVDSTPDYNQSLQSTAANGNLFLTLTGAIITDSRTSQVGTLFSGLTPTPRGVAGAGRGFLDVTGGLAAAYFDTNTVAITNGSGNPAFADLQFTSSFQLLPTAITSDDGKTYALFGTNDMQGDSVAVPEPGSLALLALGLLGLGVTARRKNT